MKNSQKYIFVFLASTFSGHVLAIDETSSAYQAGNIAGKIFVAVLVLLIIKKLFFKKK